MRLSIPTTPSYFPVMPHFGFGGGVVHGWPSPPRCHLKRRRYDHGLFPSVLSDVMLLPDAVDFLAPMRKVPKRAKQLHQGALTADVGGFRPEDISVKVDEEGRTVEVSAQREERRGDGVRVRTTTQRFRLPEGAGRVRATLDRDGRTLRLETDSKASENKDGKVTDAVDSVKKVAVEDNENKAKVDATSSNSSKPKSDESEKGQDSVSANTDESSNDKAKANDAERKSEVEMEDVGEDTQSDGVPAEAAASPDAVAIVGLQEEERDREDKFVATVDVSGFPLSCLSVETTDRDVIRVSGRVEEVDAEDGSSVVREFARRLPVRPEGKFDLENVVYRLSEDGKMLTLEAKKKRTTTVNIPLHVVA